MVKSREIRELLQSVADAAREWADSPARLRWRPTLRKWLRRANWGLVIVVVAIVLADLFVGRYQVIGPWVFGIAAGAVGVAVGRLPVRQWALESQQRPAPKGGRASRAEAAPGEYAWGFIVCLLISVGFCAVGLNALAEPARLGLPPEDASMDWSSHRDAKRPHIWWGRVRQAQCILAPMTLFVSGLAGSFAVGFLKPSGGSGAGRSGTASEQAQADAAGPHPGVLALILWLVLLVINIRI